MVDGNRCEICGGIVPEPRASHKQTKYCAECAAIKKRLTTLDSWSPDRKKAYMRKYMRDYRKRHPRLSTPYVRRHREMLRGASPAAYLNSISILLPFFVVALLLSGGLDPHSDAVPVLISYLELLAVKVTGLILVVILCWKHVARLFKE